MQDRISQHPGRIKLVPVDLENGIYDVVRADEPTQEGTPLNAANLFSESAKDAILNCSIYSDNVLVDPPSTPDAGFRKLCDRIGAVDLTYGVTWDILGANSGKGVFTNTCIKYLKLLNTVFISVTFKLKNSAVTQPSPTISVEATDQETRDILAGCAAGVPMISNAASSNPGPYLEKWSMTHNGVSSSGILIHTNTRDDVSSNTPAITLVGMYHIF